MKVQMPKCGQALGRPLKDTTPFPSPYPTLPHVTHLEGRECHSSTETNKGIDGIQKSLLFMGLAEENQDPDVHGGKRQPVRASQILNWKKQEVV